MASSTLIVHAGAKLVSKDVVRAVVAPAGTDTWFPTSHASVLDTVGATLQNAGFGIVKEQFALAKDGQRLFATLDLSSPLCEGVAIAVGVRNSTDKSFPIGLTAGSRVMVCDNLAFSSEIYVSKKHTKFGVNRFDEGISKAVVALAQYQAMETRRIAHYQNAELTETEASACLLYAFEQQLVSSVLLPKAILEWREPRHSEFAPRTAWSLFNAFTEVLKARQNQPAKFAALTMKIHGLIDRMSGYKAADVEAPAAV